MMDSESQLEVFRKRLKAIKRELSIKKKLSHRRTMRHAESIQLWLPATTRLLCSKQIYARLTVKSVMWMIRTKDTNRRRNS